LDSGVGEVLKALDETGLADQTIVVFTSDNGPDTRGPYDKRGQAFPLRAAKAKPKVIVYPSSSAVYGAWRQNMASMDIPLTEDMFDPAHSMWDQPDEMYGFTKMVGEVLAYKAAQYGVNTLCIRPFSGYGEDQSLETLSAEAERIGDQGRHRAGEHRRRSDHQQDVVEEQERLACSEFESRLAAQQRRPPRIQGERATDDDHEERKDEETTLRIGCEGMHRHQHA
jgi:hypothetical protein